MRLRPNSAFLPVAAGRRSGYTLVEILVATTLTLILMTAVVAVFGGVGDGIAKSRRAMEQFDRLRTAAQQLRQDLQGVTVTLDGRPTRPEENQGYFEYIEGGILSMPQGPKTAGAPQAISGDTGTTQWDSSVGERGDILMFTTRNAARPFLGRYALSVDPSNPTLQSDVAEVAWFLRGTTLHRRVLLVAPGVAQNQSFASLQRSSTNSYYASNDISVRMVNSLLVPNTLGDLTKRENRFAHVSYAPSYQPPINAFPFDARAWGLLGLPTLYECSSPTWIKNWKNGSTPPPPSTPPSMSQAIDYWDSTSINKAFGISSGTASPDQYLTPSADGTRPADDVILTNVIGFDVKVWEPAINKGTGGYVDLGYDQVQFNPSLFPPQGPTVPRFNHFGTPKSGLVGSAQSPCVYDSYCFSYENEGIYYFDSSSNPVNIPHTSRLYPPGLGPYPPGASTDGLDTDNDGVVDDASELITQPPYPVPLRGIQVKIRCYEPDSRQIREVTIENDFLPK
jgi:type II secretory pathway component PulJ